MNEFNKAQLKKMAEQGKRERENNALKTALGNANCQLDSADGLARAGVFYTTLYEFYGPLRFYFFGGPAECPELSIAKVVANLAKTRGFDVEIETRELTYTYKHSVVASWE